MSTNFFIHFASLDFGYFFQILYYQYRFIDVVNLMNSGLILCYLLHMLKLYLLVHFFYWNEIKQWILKTETRTFNCTTWEGTEIIFYYTLF